MSNEKNTQPIKAEPVKIAVIDTGYNPGTYQHFTSVSGKTIKKTEDGFEYSDGYKDQVGHGTIVCNLLDKYLQNEVELFFLKIFEEDQTTDVELLTEAINYCNREVHPDIIQISMGVLQNSCPLLGAVQTAAEAGTVITSAFDNEKCLSYPAAYEEVIGVDVSQMYKELTEFCLSEYDVVDLIGADIYHRGKGLEDKNFIVHGSSFYCSFVTALAAEAGVHKAGKSAIKDYIKKKAKAVIGKPEQPAPREFKIGKAVVFPFNKENHSLAAFESTLPYEICGYYDVRQSGKVNRTVDKVLGYSDNKKTIENIDSLNWDGDFDTFICGHTGEMSEVLGYNVLEKIAQQCSEHGKQLFCYDNGAKLAEKYPDINLLFPAATQSLVPKYRFGKMRTPNVPTVGVFGTSSKQGKMTVQLMLRQAFLKKGIKVRNIGSEPESRLLGFEFTYVFGYNSINTNSPQEMVLALNEAVFELEKTDCDIIIAGSQSGTVPHQLRNLEMLTLSSYYFLLGIQPDSVVLCVNCYDSFEYIERTLKFIESSVGCKVLCLCVSYVNQRLFPEGVRQLDDLKKYFRLPVFNLQEMKGDEMAELIENYYGG